MNILASILRLAMEVPLPRSYAEALFLLGVLYICFGWMLILWRRWLNQKAGFVDECLGTTGAEGSLEPLNSHSEVESSYDAPIAGDSDEHAGAERVTMWTVAQFMCMGFGMQQPLMGENFPNYTYRKKGVIVALLLMGLSTSVLVPQTEEELFAIAEEQTLCPEEDMSRLMKRIRRNFEEHTNISRARAQDKNISDFWDALQQDVKLFGTGSHTCPLRANCPDFLPVPSNTQAWNERHHNQSSKPFYDDEGWCYEVLDKGLFCQKNAVGGNVGLPTTTRPPQEFKRECEEWKRWCLRGVFSCCKTYKRVEVPSQYRPSPHTGSEPGLPNIIKKDLSEQWKEYEVRREVRRMNKERFQGINDQVRQEHWSREATMMIMDQAETVRKRANEASTFYTVYKCLTLLFPVPLVLFHEPIKERLRRSLCTMTKGHFISTFVAVGLIAEFVKVLLLDERFRLYLGGRNVLQHVDAEPCFADRHFMMKMLGHLGAGCVELRGLQSNYTSNSNGVEIDLEMARDFSFNPHIDECQCPFPTHSLEKFVTACPEGFEKQELPGPGWCAPKPDEPWYGTTSICDDIALMVEKVIIAGSEPRHLNSWQLLVHLQVLWRLFSSVLACNVILSILLLVDPLCIHGGKWMGHDKMTLDATQMQRTMKLFRSSHLIGLVVNAFLLIVTGITMEITYKEEARNGFHPEHASWLFSIVKFFLVITTGLAVVLAMGGVGWQLSQMFRDRRST